MRTSSRTPGAVSLGLIFILGTLVFFGVVFGLYFTKDARHILRRDIAGSEKVMGLHFSGAERTMMRPDLEDNRRNYQEVRKVTLANSVPPALSFSPVVPGQAYEEARRPFVWSEPGEVEIPADREDLAFYPVTRLAWLIKNRRLTSTELTELYLSRLKKYGPKLLCVVTLTEDLARAQARRADDEIAAGKYRGPLHGIPWGAKDLLATKGIKTTWGSPIFKDRVFEEDATVVKRLDEAGAVLVAKLSMGEFAMGDVWFGGRTRNPWNYEQGSSGSSAGSAAATAAGLVGFAIGTETLGSIVSPSTRCGVTGLRPTFGRVSRYGAMALSWSMDKIGPLCRTVEDCALVLNAIHGPDGKDLTAADRPFNWDPSLPLQTIRVGYVKKAFEADYRTKKFDEAALETLRKAGVELLPFDLPDIPTRPLGYILDAEAAAAFDELTRSGKDDLMVRQDRGAWPNSFRQSRFIPAVEYIQANRVRTLLMAEMAIRMKEIDVYLAPSFGGTNLLLTNLTGHPAVVVPDGFDDKGSPVSISFIGNLYEEAKALRVAKAFQDATDFHLRRPKLLE
jgi:Asp-tRNA(Asn)/Glu-tRNA(Gln) amidotransferase A subunit family amidase